MGLFKMFMTLDQDSTNTQKVMYEMDHVISLELHKSSEAKSWYYENYLTIGGYNKTIVKHPGNI